MFRQNLKRLSVWTPSFSAALLPKRLTLRSSRPLFIQSPSRHSVGSDAEVKKKRAQEMETKQQTDKTGKENYESKDSHQKSFPQREQQENVGDIGIQEDVFADSLKTNNANQKKKGPTRQFHSFRLIRSPKMKDAPEPNVKEVTSQSEATHSPQATHIEERAAEPMKKEGPNDHIPQQRMPPPQPNISSAVLADRKGSASFTGGPEPIRGEPSRSFSFSSSPSSPDQNAEAKKETAARSESKFGRTASGFMPQAEGTAKPVDFEKEPINSQEKLHLERNPPPSFAQQHPRSSAQDLGEEDLSMSNVARGTIEDSQTEPSIQLKAPSEGDISSRLSLSDLPPPSKVDEMADKANDMLANAAGRTVNLAEKATQHASSAFEKIKIKANEFSDSSKEKANNLMGKITDKAEGLSEKAGSVDMTSFGEKLSGKADTAKKYLQEKMGFTPSQEAMRANEQTKNSTLLEEERAKKPAGHSMGKPEKME